MDRTFKYLSFLLLASAIGVIGSLVSRQIAPLVSLEKKNKEADSAYLNWRLHASYSTILAPLIAILDDKARAFIIEESQLPLDRLLSRSELQDKVSKVIEEFTKRYKVEDTYKQTLEELVTDIIIPEYLLQEDPSLTEESDQAYNKLLRNLARYKMYSGKTLHIWALRFLTSESQFVALNVIEKYTRQGKKFNALDSKERQDILDTVSDVVTRRFMTNLDVVRQEYGFSVPPHLNMAVKERLNLFLSKKFMS